MLLRRPSIKKVIAAFLLSVFAFSITPTIVLHNWLANHKDSVRRLPSHNQPEIAKQLFNCHCDNIVAESPFTETATPLLIPVLPVQSSPNCAPHVRFSSAPPVVYSLRGPPMVC